MPRRELPAMALELAGDPTPGVALLHQPAPGQAQGPTTATILQQADDRLGKGGRAVRLEEMPVGYDGQSLGADPRGYNGFPHGQGLEDLQPRAPAHAEGDHVDCRLGNVGPY